MELALRAGEHVGCDHVEELTLSAPLLLPESEGVSIQVVIGEADPDGRRTLEVFSRPDREADGDRPWAPHATGLLSTAAGTGHGDLTSWPPPGTTEVEVDAFYDRAVRSGYHYGPSFQGLRRLWRGEGELFAEVALAEDQRSEAELFGLHPALLDAALHPCCCPC